MQFSHLKSVDATRCSCWAGLFILMLILAACGARTPERSEGEDAARLSTDLGPSGNMRVRQKFENYKQNRGQGCSSAGSGRRILITGFGPFNSKNNVSGAVVNLLQKDYLWPNQAAWPENRPFEAPAFVPSDDPTPVGALAVQRSLRFDGQDIELCLLTLSVEWDFAAAVILSEAERFQPDFILMTGYGADPTAVRLEAGALNRTSRLSGFDSRGSSLGELNEPISAWVIPPALNLPEELGMQWQPARIVGTHKERLAQFSESLGRGEGSQAWRFVPMQNADPDNSYICNNVSYAILAALKNGVVPLAGGTLVLNPKFSKIPRAAFLHYPFDSKSFDHREVWGWANLLMGIVADPAL